MENSVKIPKPTMMNRRDFLKGAAVGMAGIALFGVGFKELQGKFKERPPNTTNVLIVDITEDTFSQLDEFADFSVFSSEQLAEKLDLAQPLSIKTLSQNLHKDKNLQLSILAKILELYYAGHGKEVAATMKKTDQFLDKEIQPANLVGLSPNALRSFSVERDKIGNPTFWFEIDEEKLAELISATDARFVNLSLEVGKVGMKFEIYNEVAANPDTLNPQNAKVVSSQLVRTEDGNIMQENIYKLPDGRKIDQKKYDQLWKQYSQTKVVKKETIAYDPIDAYDEGSNPLDSLTKLANLATQFPNKMFFAAGGNPSKKYLVVDIRDARDVLERQGKWPENLIMVGYYGDTYAGREYPSGYGLDYYIHVDDLDKFGLSHATSFAAPLVLALGKYIATKLEENGVKYSPANIKAELDKLSVSDEKQTQYNIKQLNFDRIRKELKF